LVEAAQEHSDLAGPLDAWYRLAKKADWNSLTDVRQLFPSADAVDRFAVFNIKGNNYRLIVEINYLTKCVFIRHVLTHREYDKGAWKK
jgi:mRNA interferase HigB